MRWLYIIITTVLLAFCHSHAQQSDHCVFLGATESACSEVESQGLLTVIGAGVNLVFLDCSDPTQPHKLSMLPLPGIIHSIALDDNTAYVADYYSGLYVIDISNPDNPQIVGHYDTLGRVYDIAISDESVYAVGDDGLHIIDVSDHLNPVALGICETLGGPRGVAIGGSKVYVADIEAGLRVVDVSDPTSPFEVGFCWIPGYAVGVVVEDTVAYVLDNYYGLFMIDISDPEEPQEIGWYFCDDQTVDVVVRDRIAYFVNGPLGLVVLDVSDPVNPLELGFYDSPGYAICVEVDDTAVYLGDAVYGLRTLDVTVPESPQELGLYKTAGSVRSVAVNGLTAYVVGQHTGLSVIRVDDPGDPLLVGTCSTAVNAWRVKYYGGIAYVVDGEGLRTYDVSNGNLPTPLGSHDIPEMGRSVAVSDDIAYVGSAGLRLFDVGNPADPYQIGLCSLGDAVNGISVSGSIVCVANGYDGLNVIEVDLPHSVQVVGHIESPEYARSVAIAGSMAYLAANDLWAIDISDPGDPRELGFCEVPGDAYSAGALDVALYENVALVAAGESGLRIVDIRDPADMREVGYYDTPGYAHEVAIHGSTAFVADDVAGMIIVGLDEVIPVLLSAFELGVEPGCVTAQWDVIADGIESEFRLLGSCGGHEWDVPFVDYGMGSYIAEDCSATLYSYGNVVYRLYSKRDDGIWIVLAESAISLDSPSLLTCPIIVSPNPFNSQTNIEFECRQPGHVRLVIYDLVGQQIDVLVDECLPGGWHARVWGGRDKYDKLVPSGQYFCHFTAGGYSETRRMMLVK